MVPQTGVDYTVEKLQSWDLRFADSRGFQVSSISVPDLRNPDNFYFGVLEIREVYPGSRWDYTCVAEIEVR